MPWTTLTLTLTCVGLSEPCRCCCRCCCLCYCMHCKRPEHWPPSSAGEFRKRRSARLPLLLADRPTDRQKIGLAYWRPRLCEPCRYCCRCCCCSAAAFATDWPEHWPPTVECWSATAAAACGLPTDRPTDVRGARRHQNRLRLLAATPP